MPTELNAAVVRIKLEPAEAERELDRLEREVVARKKAIAAGEEDVDDALVPTPVDDARGESGARGRRRRSYDPASDRRSVPGAIGDAWQRGRQFVGTPPSVHVRNLAQGIAGAIPVFGPIAQGGMRAAEFVGEFGTAGLGGLLGALPADARPAVEAVLGGPVRKVADEASKMNARLSALDRTKEQAQDLVATAAVWGTTVPPRRLVTELGRLYEVNFALDRGRLAKKMMTREIVGGAVASEIVRSIGDAFTLGGAR